MPITTPLEWNGPPISPTAPDSRLPNRSPQRTREPIYLPDRSNPLSGQAYFDPRMTPFAEQGLRENESHFEGALSHGLDNPGLLGSSDDPMIRALEGEYTRRGDAERNLAKSENRFKAKTMASDATKTATQRQEDIYRNELDNWTQQMEYRAKREAIFNQWKAAKERGELDLFNKIFNGIGSFVGQVV